MGPGGPFQGQDNRSRNRLAATWGRQAPQQRRQEPWRQDRQGMRPGLSELE